MAQRESQIFFTHSTQEDDAAGHVGNQLHQNKLSESECTINKLTVVKHG